MFTHERRSENDEKKLHFMHFNVLYIDVFSRLLFFLTMPSNVSGTS